MRQHWIGNLKENKSSADEYKKEVFSSGRRNSEIVNTEDGRGNLNGLAYWGGGMGGWKCGEISLDKEVGEKS